MKSINRYALMVMGMVAMMGSESPPMAKRLPSDRFDGKTTPTDKPLGKRAMKRKRGKVKGQSK